METRAGALRFRRAGRLRSARQFQAVQTGGRRSSSANFVLLVMARREQADATGLRLGITASRKVGGAVVRNRVKRAVREWFRTQARSIESRDLDLVVIARRGAAGLTASAVGMELTALLESRRNDR